MLKEYFTESGEFNGMATNLFYEHRQGNTTSHLLNYRVFFMNPYIETIWKRLFHVLCELLYLYYLNGYCSLVKEIWWRNHARIHFLGVYLLQN